MRYEVKQQIDKINNATFILNLSDMSNMTKPTEEELKESLKIATSCMTLMMRELAKKDITLKELNEEIRGVNSNTL